MPFRSALSGINASAQELRIIGNNVANASTVGFKSSRAEFADVYAATGSGSGSVAIGSGVRLANVNQMFSQGNIGFTENKLDLAISGKGFFILDDQGSRAYSRAGQFKIDRDGFIVNGTGQKLIVNAADEQGGITGASGPLQLDSSNINPKATTNIDVGVNLDSTQAPPSSAPFDPDNPTSYNHSTSLTVYDSLGSPHLATFYYVKTPNANEWDVHTFINGENIKGAADPATGFVGDKVQFNGSGALSSINGVPVPPGKINYPAFDTGTGSEPLEISMNLLGATPTTQFGSAFNVNALQQNGYTSGRMAGLDIDDSGMIRARYTNGQTRTLGQVTLANFANMNGLRPLGDTNWAESFSSGPPLVGTAGSGSLGVIQSGALENSNVDLTGQLINMITTQRNFQANAQVITTADAVTQTVINIR